MTTYIIDAYAWVEYFQGTAKGAQVRDIVEDEKNTIITNAITIAELASKFSRSNIPFSAARTTLLSLSRVQEVTASLAADTGALHATIHKERKHLGLADAFVLQTAQLHKGKIVTGDQDFKGLKDVVMI